MRDTHSLSALDQVPDRLACRLRARPHQDQDPLRLWMARVVNQAVAAAGSLRQDVHGSLHDGGNAGIERVGGLASLEERVRVVGGSADEGPLRRQRPSAVLADQLA